ncbi:MAG TPA: tetratricopeptide repeat protein [Candidatus Methanoperedens sp.]|nr:tetratricopeptide repeat protein [Candidatus Methanoperedens sp.]
MTFLRGRSRWVTAGAVTLAVLWWAHPSVSAAFKNVQVSQTPPSFTLKDLAGREWKSGEIYAKGPTAVVFWATWSPRSAEVIHDLEALRAKIGPEKISIVTVNCEHPAISSADRDAIAAAAKQHGFTGPVLVDDGLIAFNDYGAMALPSTLVLGADGKVGYMLAGYPTTLRDELADAVRKAAGLPTEAEQRPVQEYVPKNHALMYYNLGRQLAGKGQDEKAEGQFATAVEKDPDFKKPHVELGLLYKRTGRTELALGEFERAKQIDPKDPEALYQVAVVSLRTAKFAEGQKLFAELLAEFPEREELALGAALAAKYQGKDEEYRKGREAAAKLFPADPRFVYEMGLVAESQKDLTVAAEFYRRAVEAALRKSR